MEEMEIIRMNVERYRRLLQANLDERTRWTIQAMLAECELKLVLKRRQLPPKPGALH
jgi:hypothetical protein